MTLLLLKPTTPSGGSTQNISLGLATRTHTTYDLTFGQEQAIVLGLVTRAHVIYDLVFGQEQAILLGLASRTHTTYNLIISNGGVTVLPASSLTDVIYQRLNPIYNEGTEVSFHLWMRDHGYKISDLPTVFGQTDDETINDAAYRWFRTGFTG